MERDVETLLTTTGIDSDSYKSYETSRDVIEDYILNYSYGFRGRNQEADDFFTKITLNKYLDRCNERTDNVTFNKVLGNNYTWQAILKNNETCLNAAALVLKKAKEQFERFNRVSMDLVQKQEADVLSPKKRSFWAKTFNLGRQAKYDSMTIIAPSLYFVTLYFAYAFFMLELKLTQECITLHEMFKTSYNENMKQFYDITQLYPYSQPTDSEPSAAIDYSDYKPSMLSKLLDKMAFDNMTDNIQVLREFIDDEVDSFMAKMRPTQAGGRMVRPTQAGGMIRGSQAGGMMAEPSQARGLFWDPLPLWGGRRTRRRSSLHSRKSMRGKKRGTKHRVRRV
jgi:hypothetical protein